MSSSEICILASIFVYLAAMIVIGVICAKQNGSTDDFYLGGRRLGPIVTAMSAEASDMSSWLLMGLPGVALLAGLAEASWTAIGLAVGTYLNWLFVAKRIRRYSQRIDAVTVPAFFAKRFHDDGNLLTLVAALVIIVFFVPYTASGFNACGTLFSSLFGIEYLPAMLISAAVIVIYTTMGGFLAASTTDLIQSIVMTIALAIVIFFGISYAGGWDAVAKNAASLPGYLNLTSTYDAASGTAVSYGGLTIASTLAWGLGYFGMPHILLRFMAIQDIRKLKTSRRIATVWVVISMAAAVLIGVIGYGMTQSGALETMTATTQSQRVIIKIAALISTHGVLPAILAGVILAGILAATMSTSDSQLLAAASSVSENILCETFRLKLSGKKNMFIARATVVCIAVIAAVWARKEGSVFSIVSFAWAGFGASFGPVVLCSLFWKRANKWGALAGMIVGGVMIFVWKYVIAPWSVTVGLGFLNIYELLPAFVLAAIAIVVVSLLTPAPPKEAVEEFEDVAAMKD